jgi:hypothetical protein
MTFLSAFARHARAALCVLLVSGWCSVANAQSWPPAISLEPQEPVDVRTEMTLGYAVSLYGSRALVGAPLTDGVGAVYVFQRQSGRWVQTQKLLVPGATEGHFGDLITQDDGTALIADLTKERVYYFERATTGSYRPLAVLRGGSKLQFGDALALEGCVALISSASGIDRNAPRPGLVHVFNRCPSGNWVWKGSFGAPDARDGDLFGSSLAMIGKSLLVGAPGMNAGAGAAYSFSYSNGAWRLKQKITQTTPGAGNAFGTNVSFRNGLAVIGAPNIVRPDGEGEIELYKQGADTKWVSIGTMAEPADAPVHSSQFGARVKVTNDRVFVTSLPLPQYNMASAVFAFRRVGDTLQLEKGLISSEMRSVLGASIDASAGYFIVGEPGRQFPDVPFSSIAGAADVYTLPP